MENKYSNSSFASSPMSMQAGGRKLDINIAPHYDNLSSEYHKSSLSHSHALKKVVSKNKRSAFVNTAKYFFAGAFGLALFYIAFNWQVVSRQANYALFGPPETQVAVIETNTTTNPSTPNTSALVSEQDSVEPQPLMIIPKINVNAPVNYISSTDEDNIQDSLESGVVHYAGTAKPGEPGNVVVVGHSSNDPWKDGEYKFVFALLEQLTIGDQIQVNYNSKKFIYEVHETLTVEPTQIDVLYPTSEPQLTLITCTPPGTNWKRFIVNAKQVYPVVTDDQILDLDGIDTDSPLQIPATVSSNFDVEQIPGNEGLSVSGRVAHFIGRFFGN